MPRTKKEGLSPAVGTLSNSARKSGNPEFVSSSFYVPKGVNNAFNRALLTLKDATTSTLIGRDILDDPDGPFRHCR